MAIVFIPVLILILSLYYQICLKGIFSCKINETMPTYFFVIERLPLSSFLENAISYVITIYDNAMLRTGNGTNTFGKTYRMHFCKVSVRNLQLINHATLLSLNNNGIFVFCIGQGSTTRCQRLVIAYNIKKNWTLVNIVVKSNYLHSCFFPFFKFNCTCKNIEYEIYE